MAMALAPCTAYLSNRYCLRKYECLSHSMGNVQNQPEKVALCQTRDAAKQAAEYPQVFSAFIGDGSKYVQRGRTSVRASPCLHICHIRKSRGKCVASCMSCDNTGQSRFASVCCSYPRAAETFAGQQCISCESWLHVQTFFPGNRRTARLGGDMQVEIQHLEGQLAEKQAS